jgi:hypothetical protein
MKNESKSTTTDQTQTKEINKFANFQKTALPTEKLNKVKGGGGNEPIIPKYIITDDVVTI